MKAKENILAGAMLAGMLAAAGCVQMRVSGGIKQYEPPRSGLVTTNSVATKVDFYPEAVRKGGDRVEIRVKVTGSFADEITEKKPYKITPEVRMSMGLLPGISSLGSGLAAGGTVFALWYNICFLGLPTLNGLLIEPFNPSPVPSSYSIRDGHAFRRSALLGFHKFKRTGAAGMDEARRIHNARKDTRTVEDVTMEFRASPVFWQAIETHRDCLVLKGVQPGAHEGELILTQIPPGHYLAGTDLAQWVDFPVAVQIPEN